MKHYGLESNPVKIVGRFKKNDNEVKKDKDKLRYITLDQFNKFISVIDDKVVYALFNFAFYTGCRKGEMFALKWEEYRF